jgi:hypothetical protein
MPTKKPPTRRQLEKRFDVAYRAALKKLTDIDNKASLIEGLLADPRSNDVLLYALQAVLTELSNESGFGVDTPTVAGDFYSKVAFECRDSDNEHIKRCLRHLDVLLSKPTVRTANALIKYWDDNKSADLKRDPFPRE